MSFFARQNDSSSDDDSDSGNESLSSGDEAVNSLQKKINKPKSALNKSFLRDDLASDSDSDSEDSDSDDSDSDDSDSDSDAGKAAAKGGRTASAFLRGAAAEDSDSDDERKVVKSAKDKRLDEMEATVKIIENASKINDWVAISNEFDKLARLVARHQTLTSTLPPAAQMPGLYIKSLIDMDTQIIETTKKEKDAKKKMNAANAKGLNGMKQKIKKSLREYEETVAIYKSDPDAFEAAYEAAVSSGSGNAAAADRETQLRAKEARRAAGEEQQEGDDFMTVGRGGRALQLTSEGVFKTLKSIAENRGRKNVDRADTIKILEKLLEVSSTPYQKIRVLLAIIASRLDYSATLPSIPHGSWVSALGETNELITMLLGAEKDYLVTEETDEYDDMIERAPSATEKRVKVRGSLISFVENLDNEFTKTLQNSDQHGSEYVERLREEKPLYETIVKAQVLFEREGWAEPTARAVIRRLEHVYSKPSAIVEVLEKSAVASLAGESSKVTDISTAQGANDLVYALSVNLYRDAPALIRTRAMLCHIYHNALNGRYHEARDMLLMSHLQDSIQHADVTTQILYNRVVVQIGLAAFKKGYISDCQSTLLEIFASQRHKELLAQGIQRFSQNTPEQELIEKRRLLPFHLHINLELLETAFLVSCMLIEIPLLASLDTDESKRKSVSRPFRRLLEQADRQAFMGPPESPRDHIMQASKALQAGQWEKARDLILSIKIWSLLDNATEVKERLAKNIQEQGLRTYLFTYAPYYDSISLDLLASTFALPRGTVTAIASKMIWTEELAASLDQIDGVIVFHRAEQSRVQQLAQELATKAEQLLEYNERVLDQKLGTNENRPEGGRDARQGEGGRGRNERRGRGGYRGRGGKRGNFNSGLGSNKVAA